MNFFQFAGIIMNSSNHRHTEHETLDVRDKCVRGQDMSGETVSLLLRTPFRDKPNITNITALEFSEAIEP